MASEKFRNIIKQKIDIFASTFGDDADTLFKTDGNLIHPGEYGMYRERCTKELLKCVCDRSIAISDGFIISSEDNISKQCDIIMYQSDTMPVIDNGIANFFPVEIVKGIGEVKSNLKKSELKKTLVKLANNKKMFLERKGAQEPKLCLEEKDEIISFLICNKLDFRIEDLDFDDIYQDVPDLKFRHNMILSLQDGLFVYEFITNDTPQIMKEQFTSLFGENESVVWYFPHSSIGSAIYKCKNNFIEADSENIYEHIIQFLYGLNHAMYGQREYELDMGVYLTDDIIKLRE